jgi:hypothetical protein
VASLTGTVAGIDGLAPPAPDHRPLAPALPAGVPAPRIDPHAATDVDALVAAVADRLAEQLAVATDDLGVEV